MIKSVRKNLYKRLGKRHLDDDEEGSAPRPPEEAYLFDSMGYALCDSQGFILDTTE